jgi:hypothetical protein
MNERTDPCFFEMLVDISLDLGILRLSTDEFAPFAKDVFLKVV